MNGYSVRGVYTSEPCYESVSPLTTAKPLSLGSILVADLEVGAGALIDLIRATERSPWSPVCLRVGSRPADASLLQAARLLPESVACITADAWSGLAGSAIANTIRRRDRPSRAQIAAYVIRRNGWQGREADVVKQCIEWEEPQKHSASHRSTIWRRLMSIGVLTQSDWTDLTTLAIHCTDCQLSYERLALKCGWDGKTLRKRGKQLVGPLFDRRVEFAGWEWLVEAGLRKAGYLAGGFTIPAMAENRSATG